ncbi:arylesterase [Lichenibacterium ramalinae]|uniref:Arylesterase n=1 Tax=Lichenibacterium ramalinae TaxID=2316527 RepID=A0A4Q2RH10_9HYPH|nr:arylesterase [Lichenibacterium ramalinae]RYB07759.1 arylesterase [Lichenibacterium ramalinae]
MVAATLAAALCAASAGPARAATRIAAFGDSLSAGYQLPAAAAFPAVLEGALRRDGYDVAVDNAAVSGDTTQGGVERLDWSVPDGTALAIVELGANDMLRGIDPAVTAKNLDAIVSGLQKRHIGVLLAGMYASLELDAAYRERFAAIFPSLAKRAGVPLYPFFLAGIIGHPELHLADGVHPNAAGVAVIVRNILPTVEESLKGLGVQPSGVKG